MDVAGKMYWKVDTQINVRGEKDAVVITSFSIGDPAAFRKAMETVISVSREMGYTNIFYEGDMDLTEQKLFGSCGFRGTTRIVHGDMTMFVWREL